MKPFFTGSVMSSPSYGSNSITNMIQQWNQTQAEESQLKQEYLAEIQKLLAIAKSGNPGEALYLFQLEAMPMITQSGEYQMKLQAEALGISNQLRNAITNAQNAYNDLLNQVESGTTALGKSAAKVLSQDLEQLQDLLKTSGLTQIFGSHGASQINNFNSFIKSITNNMNGANGTRAYSNLKHLYSNIQKQGGIMPPAFNNITTNFDNLNQSVSGISSTIQSQMQTLNQNLQQYFGIYKSFFDDFSQLNSYIISRSQQ